METKQMTPFFHLLFLLELFVTSIPESLRGPAFGPFRSVKYLDFWSKAIDSDSLSYFPRN